MSEQKYDVIIAGSGLGGLICGYILAKNGYKIAIFEKNPQIGGCLQTFKRNGVTFDTGMHYIGSMDEGQILHRFFKYLNLLDDVKLSRLDTNGYEVINFAGKEYRFANGSENFVKTLAEQFPDNEEEIRTYLQQISKIAESSPLYNLHQINSDTFINTQYAMTSVNEFIENITKNPLLQNILAGNMPLYAGVKDKTPIYVMALINNFFIQSAFRIVGGSDSIANSLAKSIETFGGKIFRNAEIDEFLCNETKMTQIRLTNGKMFDADYFISNIHPEPTLAKIHSPLIRTAYRQRISSIENTISNFTLFVKFKENSVKYLNFNYYYYDCKSIWNTDDYDTENFPQIYLYMHQAVAENQEFAQSAQIITYMPYAEVSKWDKTTVGKRGADYEQFKKDKAEKIIDKLTERFPDFRSSIEEYYTCSPLTYRDYTGTVAGSMYGILRDKNFPLQTRISQRTKIPNFFFTGQNINSHGILGVTIGAIITSAEIVDANLIINEIGC
ncbi:MAG: NAD(P)/FAD-dependent oxidoreductase [Paludibacter sp.]|jgi:all-trans-retinol 13,14-reductase|nr:NAD(P)/FAD-dependent oxidoreductase [Paludibacter sp.]